MAGSYLAAPYNRLNGPGPMGDASSANVEQLLKLQPDIIMFMADASDRATLERLDQLRAQTHIPAYMIEMQLKSMPDDYTNPGALLGVEKRASILAKYCRDTLQDVPSKVKTIPMEKRPKVYYAGGPDGLKMLFAGSPHAEPIE